jgi:hypothetical protein
MNYWKDNGDASPKKNKLIFIFKGTRRSVASISQRRSEFDPQPKWLRFFVNDLTVGQFSFFQMFRFPLIGAHPLRLFVQSAPHFHSTLSGRTIRRILQTFIIIIIIIIISSSSSSSSSSISIIITATTGQKSTFSFLQASDYLTQNPIASILATLSLMKIVLLFQSSFNGSNVLTSPTTMSVPQVFSY